uniref:Tetratricopeptide repeat protein 5-like n=1 Tax=Diabrotica virgifera virgifera TaxID=50390 RepID=A0A6P7G2P1_DIAVI
MEALNNCAPKCNCEREHEDVVQFLNNETDSLYTFRDRYFETHNIEEAIKKEEETEKILAEKLKIFKQHEHLVSDLSRAKYCFLKGKLLNVVPNYNKEAESLLSKSIKLDPKLVDAWNELGECYWKNDDLKKSINCFEGALKEKKNKISLRSLSMLVRQEPAKTREEKVKNIEKGLTYAKEAVQLDPQDGLSWTVLGNAYLSSFFGIQQNPKILKQCLSAYSQANCRGLNTKTAEFYKNCLEGNYDVVVAVETWLREDMVDGELIDINVFNLLRSDRNQEISGKTKGGGVLMSIDSKQLGPYGGGTYTSPNGTKVKLVESKLKHLKDGINEEIVVLGKVVCSVRNEDTVPFTFCMVDKDGTCVVVTIFNIADGKGVIIGDSVAIAEPFVTDVDFSYKNIDYKFRLIRVENPVILVVNGRKVSKDLQAEVQMSIFKKYD